MEKQYTISTTYKAIVLAVAVAFMAPTLKAQTPTLAEGEEPATIEHNTPVANPQEVATSPAAPIQIFTPLPNDRFFIKPHFWCGYNIGKNKSGWGYGGGLRFLYDFRARFLGGSVFAGIEVSYMAPLGFVADDTRSDASSSKQYNRQNYLVLPLILEQNYPLFKSTFTIGTGVGYYKGVQANRENAVGLITNIGWFPIYKGKAITPQITYRNDWVFDKNQTNTQSLCIALNF